MKLACFILICVLILGHSAKMLAQRSDSVAFTFDPREQRMTISLPAPEIYSFVERVQLWDNLFGENRQIISICDFGSRIRNEIQAGTFNDISVYSMTRKWDWKVTNAKVKCKFSPSDRRLRKDYLRPLWAPYDPDNSVTATYDWTLNNQNPFSRQSVRLNLINFPKLYFAIQLFSFIQIIDDFIRQIPTSYHINDQWKISYRKEMVVLSYTY